MALVAGILLIIISLAHNIYGEKKQLPELRAITDDPIMVGSLRIMIYQGGVLLLATGIVQVLVATGKLVLTGPARYFPVGIVAINFLTGGL